ncbi:MAG: DNA polymerase I [Clostridiales bacterium]|nr:DNA polymerase I [Clostridiales bacterium]
MEKLVLIDGNSLINRAFYATPVFTTKSGTPTNGVFGFIKLMLKIIADKKPTHFAVAFDLHAPTFRHKLYADYKAGRKSMPEELAIQMPILKEVLTLMNVKILELAGYEADDLLGTMAKKFNMQTYVYTGDRDAYQLVDETTNVCYTRKGVSDILELSLQNFKDEIGITPSQIIDYKALMGDKSDNIPGVAGVGDKSALSLLERFFDIDGVYAHIDEITGALRTKLENGKDNAYFSKQLATIDTNAPLNVELNECLLKMPFSQKVKEKFSELEFRSLLTADIFNENDSAVLEDAKTVQTKKIECVDVYPASVEEIVSIIDGRQSNVLACNATDKEIRFIFLDEAFALRERVVEYVLPIKQDLLDAGFFDWELAPVFTRLIAENMHIIAYNVKDIMHTVSVVNSPFLATYDDVSVLKCIVDGLGNSSGLTYALNENDVDDKFPACGVALLCELYSNRLTDTEKNIYKNIELPLIKVLFGMEKEGVCVDEEALYQTANKFNAELAVITKEIHALAGESFNVNSTQQLGKILFEKLKIGGDKKKKDGKYKTTAEELEKYADEYEIVRLILRYRKIQKLNSTYVEGFKPLLVNGKVHTTYNQSFTSTGRLSSANPNLQNIPIRTEEGRELRKLFKASPGNVLIDADYSQIELRLLAHFSGCKELIAAYCEGKDIHALTASQVFDTPLEKVSSSQRRSAKAVNFGIIYGISAFGLSKDLSITPKKAQEYINKYFESYSDVKEYMQKNVQTARDNGYVETLFGRRRVINEIKSSNFNVRSFGERAAMNMPLQGSSAEIIKLAMIHVAEEIKQKGYKARLVLQVHDELVIDCPENEAEEVAALLKEKMETAVSLLVPLTVDIASGKSWYETK